MILPFFLDRIPEKIGSLYAKLFSWSLEGKRVLLTIDEGAPGLSCGSTVLGTIVRLEAVILTPSNVNDYNPPCAIIRLESGLEYKGRGISWLVAQPRLYGHGFYRLPITSNVVQVFPVNNPEPPHILSWENMIAICTMKLARKKLVTERELS